MQDRISTPQWTAWLLAAAVGPILSMAGRGGWISIAIFSVLCIVVSLCVMKYGTGEIPKWLAGLECLWLILVIGSIAKQSGTCWEDAKMEWLIPGLLLILAGFATQHGAGQASRVGATLIWVILPILGIVLLAGTIDAQVSWIREAGEVPEGVLIALLLLPCITVFLPGRETQNRSKVVLLLCVIAIAGSVLLDATLGAQVAQEAENGFYEFCKSVNLFGVAERFEALVACALTGGWFALYTVLLSVAYHFGEKLFPQHPNWFLWGCVAISVAVMCTLHIPTQWLAVGTLIFWGFLPVLAQGLGGEKKVVKSKK